MTVDLAKQIGSAYRDHDTLISGVGRHLLKEAESDRRSDCIHPSEAASENWCPRATYYRISGAETDPAPRWLAMEMVFEDGNSAHTKWQTWFREMGTLGGTWYCSLCRLVWEDVSPHTCPRCEAGYDLIKYAEVPVADPYYLIAGQADGDVIRGLDGGVRERVLIEAKTIGTGTLRYDAPKLIDKYTYQHTDEEGKVHSYTDWPALWQGIRRPFPAHLRQGMIYCFCAGRKKIVFIYDPKFLTAYPKEFEVEFRKDFIEDILETCLLIKSCLDKQRPPKRPIWAEQSTSPCKKCAYKSTCWGSRAKDDSRPDRGVVEELGGSESNAAKEEALPAKKTKVRFAEAPY